MIILDEYSAAVETALSPAKGHCRSCSEDRAAAMQNRNRICYACDCRRGGRAVTEEHHLFGPDIPVTVHLPVNEHRVLDEMRLSRPDFLREPGSDLLVNFAQLLLLFGEVAAVAADQSRRKILPEWIEPLADLLGDLGQEAAEALLLFGGHVAECPAAEWHKRAPKWTPTSRPR